jgi:dUTP pyrophosphatase
MQLKFKKLHPSAKLPVKGSLGAACFDVYATEILIDDNNRTVTYKLGFATEFSKDWMGIVVSRSSISKYDYVMANSIGIIDSDYRGEWMVKFKYIGLSPHPINIPYDIGDRIAQIFFTVAVFTNFQEVEELEDSQRGTGGFGSTGTN